MLKISPQSGAWFIWRGSAKWMLKIWDAYCRFQNLIAGFEVSVCTKFQLDSSYSHKVMVPHVIFLHSVTTEFNMFAPKWIGILPDPRQVSVPSFKLIAPKPFELCSSDPKMNMHLAWKIVLQGAAWCTHLLREDVQNECRKFQMPTAYSKILLLGLRWLIE